MHGEGWSYTLRNYLSANFTQYSSNRIWSRSIRYLHWEIDIKATRWSLKKWTLAVLKVIMSTVNSSKVLKCLLPGSRGGLSWVLSCQFLTIFFSFAELQTFYLPRFTLLIENDEIAISEFSQVCKWNYIVLTIDSLLSKPLLRIMALFVSCFFVNVLFNYKLYPSMALVHTPCT